MTQDDEIIETTTSPAGERLREALDWIYKDICYAAPETIPDRRERWLERILWAIYGE